MTDHKINFKELKARLSWDVVLGKYGGKLRRINQEQRRGDCPFPFHGKSTDTFTVKDDPLVFSCQSDSCFKAKSKHGKKGGDILDFVMAMEGLGSLKEAAEFLDRTFPVSIDNRLSIEEEPELEIVDDVPDVCPPKMELVVVVQSPWSVMRLAEAGIPAIAFGVNDAPAYVAQLIGIPKVVVMFDPDERSAQAAEKLVLLLSEYTFVRRVIPARAPYELEPSILRSYVP